MYVISSGSDNGGIKEARFNLYHSNKWKATSNLCYRCGGNEARRIIGESYERDDETVKDVTTMEEQEEATVAVAMEDWNGEKF